MSSFDDFLSWERASRDTIDFKVAYVDMADGDLVAGLLLSQIVFWFLPKRDGTSKCSIERDGYLWIAKKVEDWWEECRIKRDAARRALDVLVSAGIVETRVLKFNGTPTTHIRIIEDGFMSAWSRIVGPTYGKPVNSFGSPNQSRFTGNTEVDLRETRKSSSSSESTAKSTGSSPVSDILGHEGFDLTGTRPPETNGRKYPEEVASRIHTAVVTTGFFNTNAKPSLPKWAESIRLWMLKYGMDRADIDPVLEWFEAHVLDKWTPHIRSANSFCDRFADLQDARKRDLGDAADDPPPPPPIAVVVSRSSSTISAKELLDLAQNS